MKKSSTADGHSSCVALLWDESFLWGLMSFKALQANKLPFDLIRSEDVQQGKLSGYRMLFVPGGWASNKLKTLGDAGVGEIRRFIAGGGSYLGFCGGAGLSTLDGIGLLDVKRKPTKERVPSFSGRIRLNLTQHSIWSGLDRTNSSGAADDVDIFHAWWPSQVSVKNEKIRTLATYGHALPDSFSSDLNVGDTAANGGWSKLEKAYSIRLDPGRLIDDPAVVEGVHGKGKVVLSLIHFDTPDDENGCAVLKNLWEYLAGWKAGSQDVNLEEDTSGLVHLNDQDAHVLSELESKVEGLIDLGIRNFLWFWRNPMLLQWRRGVRGLEYCTLFIIMKEIAARMRSGRGQHLAGADFQGLGRIKALLIPFVEQAKSLLVMERLAMQREHITYDKCDDPEIMKMRIELFSNSKSYGGLFKHLINEMDAVLFQLIKQ